MTKPAALNLDQASKEWANRPDDERFASLSSLHDHCTYLHDRADEVQVDARSLTVGHKGADLFLTRGAGPVHFTNWSFGQMCRRIAAPASYLTSLPVALAADCLNSGLQAKNSGQLSLLLHANGRNVLRAATSDRYARIWNKSITSRLLSLEAEGWQVPPARPCREGQRGSRPATERDVLAYRQSGLSIQVGDTVAPAGLYASDRDMFAFLVNENNRIKDGTEGGLARGFFVKNSEVGDCSFTLTAFLYRFVCGNHIVWGAENVAEVKIRHVGEADGKAFHNLSVELRKYTAASAKSTEDMIVRAKACQLAKDEEGLLDLLFNRRIASRDALEASYVEALKHEDVDGAPVSAWGFAQGMTRYSQTLPYTADRTDLDIAAGKVLSMAT